MTTEEFDAGRWVERVAAALAALAQAQEPYLHAYWQHNQREQLIVDGKDETPFPLDDVRMVYAEARYSRTFGREDEYARLRALLDPARHALLSHPILERVAVARRTVGENDFWMRMVNSGTSVSAGDLIAGLMARAAGLCQVNRVHSEILVNCRRCSTQFQWLSLMEKCRKQPTIG